MLDKVERTAQHWDEHTVRFSGRNAGLFWWEVPEVLRHINRKISSSPDIDWVEYTVRKHFKDRLPLDRCLSLGCGVGQLERSLARLGAFRRCDAYDVSEGALREAKAKAERAGFTNINYSRADVNRLELPHNVYDAVWTYGAMHHFEELEYACAQIQAALKPAGLLVINEYVGPARFQFPSRQKEVVNLCLRLLPARYRTLMTEAVAWEAEKSEARKRFRRFLSDIRDRTSGAFSRLIHRHREIRAGKTSGGRIYREAVGFPTVDEVIADDPSESARSNEILKLLERDFQIVERTDWGGNIPQFLLAGIAGNFTDEDRCSRLLVKMLWNIEDTLLKCGEFDSDFVYLVARPRKECA